ncbi:MAG: pilus assembly protein [Beijerinckiaceae bacterium]|nr:MAG: pilus assembly protein [Beijerinckiaceae bacterium]
MRKPAAAHRALRSPLRLLRDGGGVAATEFALMVPIMLVLFVGVAEVGQAIAISRKVTITVRTVTDLVTQYAALSTTDMGNLLGASEQVIAPYPSGNLAVTVSEVSTDASGNATITWSQSLNGTAYKVGQQVTLPTGMNQPNISLIWGQAQYKYTPVLGDNIIGATTLSDQIYMNSRLCQEIAYGSSVTTSTNTSSCAVVASSGSGSGSSGGSGSGSGGSGSGSGGSSGGSGGSGSGSGGSSGGSGGSGSGSGSGSGGGSNQNCWYKFCW